MSVTIYWGSGSPVSWRALLALEIKQIPYTSHQLKLSDKEHRSAAFLALSPRGTFPVLQDADYVVRESVAILAYLDAAYPKHPLLGTSPAEVGMIWQHLGEHEDHLGDAVQTITRSFFRKAGVADVDALNKALQKAQHELGLLDALLENKDWLVGQDVSAADIVYYPTIHRLLRAASKPIARQYGLSKEALQPYSALQGWLERMRLLPGVDATYPPHWREA